MTLWGLFDDFLKGFLWEFWGLSEDILWNFWKISGSFMNFSGLFQEFLRALSRPFKTFSDFFITFSVLSKDFFLGLSQDFMCTLWKLIKDCFRNESGLSEYFLRTFWRPQKTWEKNIDHAIGLFRFTLFRNLLHL